MSKTLTPPPATMTPAVQERTPEDIAEGQERVAEHVTGPHAPASLVIATMLRHALKGQSNEDCPTSLMLHDALEERAKKLGEGDLSDVEAALASQATALAFMFQNSAMLAAREKAGSDAQERQMRLALRCQAQAARTLEILGNLKTGAKVIFTSQVNAAHQQVVQNGSGSPPADHPIRKVRSARKENSFPATLPKPSTPLLTNAPLDTRSPKEAAPGDQSLEPVEIQHRPKNSRRKADVQ